MEVDGQRELAVDEHPLRVADHGEVLEVELRALEELLTFGAGDGRHPALLHRCGTLAKSCEHFVDVELIVGHGPKLPAVRDQHTRPTGQVVSHRDIRVPERTGVRAHGVGLMGCDLAHE